MPIKFDKNSVEVNVVNGVADVVYTDRDAYKKSTEISVKTLKDVEDYRAEYIEECVRFSKELAQEMMKKDKSITRVNTDIPFSTSKRGYVGTTVDRAVTVRMPRTGEVKEMPRIKAEVKDPLSKCSKSIVKALAKELLEKL